MADDQPTPTELTPEERRRLLIDQNAAFFTAAEEAQALEKLGKVVEPAIATALAKFFGGVMTAGADVAAALATRLAEGEEIATPAFGRLAATAIKDLLGADVSPADFAGRGQRNQRTAASSAIGSAVLRALVGSPNAIDPSTEPAKQYITTVMQLGLEGWLQGWITEFLTSVIPGIDNLQTFGELDDILSNTLGLGRLSRRVIGPFLDVQVVRPTLWHVNKQYRPELLTPSELARQVARGRLSREAALEELARQGWSPERSEALLSNAAKFFSVADAYLSWRMGMWSREQAAAHLREQGYTIEQADHALQLQTARDVAAFEESLASAAVTAYADRRITRAEFSEIVRSSLHDQQTAARLIELGEARRALNRRQLSASEARRLAFARILSVIDYRRALEAEGYDDFAVTALELELRQELEEQRDLEELRAQQAAERAAEKQRRAEERARREAELAEKRARSYPALAEFKRAYVRGLIPLDRYAAALAREKVAPEDADFLIADAELEREAYRDQIERRRQAEARDTSPGVPIGVLEESVLRGIIPIEDYARDLERREFDPDEVRTFVNLLANRVADRRRAEEQRAEADRRAQLSGVSLATWERAVRMGVRNRAQYAAFLEALGTPEIAEALILDLLDAQLRADDEARRAREAAEAAARARGLSLDQRRRAVLMGVRPIEYYSEGLIASGLDADAQRVLLDLLEVELDAAEAARQRREEMAGALDDPELSLSQIERAVRLGILAPDALRERARARGFSAEDAELLVQLAVLGIPDVRRGQEREREVSEELRARGISLGDFKQLVRRGIRSPEEYTAFLAQYGYTGDDAALLRQLLEEEIGADLDGLRARIAAKLAKAENAPPLAEFEAALRSGEIDALQLRDLLSEWGAGRDESLVYARLLFTLGSEAPPNA